MTREEWLVQYLTEHHKEELENILADLSKHSIGYDSITWSCGFGSITMTLGKAKELLKPSLPSYADEAAEQAMPASYSFLEVDIYGGSEPVYSYEQMKEMFRAGVAYDRAKMLEEAVEGEVYLYESYKRTATAILVDIPKENLGDKVRIVVLKAEEEK